MRSTQIFGLSKLARDFLRENHRPVFETCPTCGHDKVTDPKEVVYKDESALGMFDDGPALMEYILEDGRICREVVQATKFSSGPCIFLCLEVGMADGQPLVQRIGEWTEQEIEMA